QPNSHTTVEWFNVTRDILDLRAFPLYSSVLSLNATPYDGHIRRSLRTGDSSPSGGSVVLHFPRGQSLLLMNITLCGLQASSILFATVDEQSETLKAVRTATDNSRWSLVFVGGGIAVTFALYLVYKSVWL